MRIVSLGDSVTVGIGDRPTAHGDLGWAAHLARSLRSDHFINVSRVGARARDVLAEQLPIALRQRPDLATVLVGGNDVLRGNFDARRIAGEIGSCADALRCSGSDVMVVLLHDPQRVLPKGGWTLGRVIGVRARALNEHVSAALREIPGVVTLDPSAYRVSYDPRSWHVDRMHPSVQGHRALAAAAGERLRCRGWEPCEIAEAPHSPPNRWSSSAWLIRNGVPWFAKRSIDLVPELISVVISERRSSLRTCV